MTVVTVATVVIVATLGTVATVVTVATVGTVSTVMTVVTVATVKIYLQQNSKTEIVRKEFFHSENVTKLKKSNCDKPHL